MHLRDAHQLTRYLHAGGLSQADLGRAVGVSRQFIHMLTTGARRGCTGPVGARIEEALHLLPGTLFAPSESPDGRLGVNR
ncbi:helix-turn-helix transcriptional regulator [Cellulomonas sp. NPDC089187]|uniref:helix-turn-helix transcriptional regulator n=1 Tax=Cellulomonas sp. NPDC089187 TaxID=3154970 RepID=UPI0034293C6F